MTNDNPKCEPCSKDSHEKGYVCHCPCHYAQFGEECLKAKQAAKPLPSEPKCEHEHGDFYVYKSKVTEKSISTYKKDVGYICPFCKTVEPLVDIKKDCWLFTGRIEKSGYGRKGGVSAHRLSYQTFVGKIPKGKFVLHKCDVRNCINPNHLYLGTSKDNMRDCLERGRHPRLNRNSCGRGHPYTKDTIQYKYSRGQKYRYCKECEYIKRKQRQEKKRLRNERNRKCTPR